MLSTVGLVVVCLAYLVLASVVLLKNSKALLNRVFGGLLVTIALWNSVVFLEDVVAAQNFVPTLARLDYALASGMLGFFYWFCMLLSRRRWKSLSWVVALLTITSVTLSITGFITSVSVEGAHVVLRPGSGFLVIVALLVIALSSGIFSLVRRFVTTVGVERSQITLVGLGLILTAIAVVLTLIVVPRIFGVADAVVTRVGLASTLIFASLSAYAVVRHHFLDIRATIARAFAYVFTLGSLALLYVIAMYTISSRLFSLPDVSVAATIVHLTLALVLAFLFQGVRHFFDRITRSLFYRDAYETQSFFDSFNKTVVSTIDLNTLLQTTTKVIASYLKAEYVVACVKDSSPQGYRLVGTRQKTYLNEDLARIRKFTPRIHAVTIVADDLVNGEELGQLMVKNNIALLVRLTQDISNNKEGIGCLMLGVKKSGNPYSNQDIEVLEAAANELIIAIQNATRFEEIERFNVTLQEKIEEATRELRHANARLRKLDHTKDDFISMASHQLRTPLTSVKGYVSMVLDGDGGQINETQRKLLTQSFLGAQRMVYLISDLLNVSRLKTGKFIIEPIHSNLDKVIEEELNQLTETIKGRGLELKYNKPEVFPELMLDETKIRQVIMNFVDNAIYYTPNGGHITVNLVETPESIDFTVVDDGIGVPKHEQHHLFGKFYRAHNAKGARPDGTGLGLFMAKKVTIAQGGAIIFKSTEGKGSTFGFTFPKAKLLPETASDTEPATKLST